MARGAFSPPSPAELPVGQWSARRIGVLVASTLVSLSSGTNYVVSAYAPQLGSRLSLTHTQLNIFAVAGNVGVYTSGPISGRIMDTRGSRPLLIVAFTTLLCGYLGVRSLYLSGLSEPGAELGAVRFAALVFCSYLTGVGGNSGMTSGMNSTAKSFSDSARAVVVGIVMSGFGLSAFFFSTLSHVLFPGNTPDFLLVLALGTAAPMLLGLLFVRPVPLPPSLQISSAAAVEDGFAYRRISFDAAPAAVRANSRTRLLGSPPVHAHDLTDDTEMFPGRSLPVPRAPLLSSSPSAEAGGLQHRASSVQARERERRAIYFEKMPEGRGVDLHGLALTRSVDFWIACALNVLFSGTGLMYINNVGSIAQALFAHNNPSYDPVVAATYQAAQVSAVSLTNFAGRIVIGVVADTARARTGMPRSYCMTLVAALFVTSQLVLLSTEDVSRLWIASACVGLAYGGLFGLLPTLCIEWFGLAHFSENWGFVSLFPVVGGNLFSLMFGRNLDAHAAAPMSPLAPSALPPALSGLASSLSSFSTRASDGLAAETSSLPSTSEAQCLAGRACYISSIYVTLCACVLATALAIYAGRRDYVHRQERVLARESVLWEDEEDEEE